MRALALLLLLLPAADAACTPPHVLDLASSEWYSIKSANCASAVDESDECVVVDKTGYSGGRVTCTSSGAYDAVQGTWTYQPTCGTGSEVTVNTHGTASAAAATTLVMASTVQVWKGQVVTGANVADNTRVLETSNSDSVKLDTPTAAVVAGGTAITFGIRTTAKIVQDTVTGDVAAGAMTLTMVAAVNVAKGDKVSGGGVATDTVVSAASSGDTIALNKATTSTTSGGASITIRDLGYDQAEMHWGFASVDCTDVAIDAACASPKLSDKYTTTGSVTCTGGKIVTVGNTFIGGNKMLPNPAPAPVPVVPKTSSPTSAPLDFSSDQFIKMLHEFFHFRGEDVFNLNREDYVAAVFGLGVMVILIGFLLLTSYFMFLCCRACCDCCRRDAICGPRFSRCLLIIFIMASTVSMCASTVGYLKYNDGINAITGSLDKTNTKFTELGTAGTNLMKAANGLKLATDTFVCDDKWTEGGVVTLGIPGNDDEGEIPLKAAAAKFMKGATAFDSAVSGPIQAKITYINDAFQGPLKMYVAGGLGGVVGLVLIYAFFGICGTCCKSAMMLNMASFIGLITLIIVVVLVAFEVSLSVMMADLCFYGPGKGAVESAALVAAAAGSDPMPTNVALYYTTCDVATATVGNPLTSYMNRTAVAMGELDILRARAKTGCGNDPDLAAQRDVQLANMKTHIFSANQTLADLADATACDAFYDEWSVTENALCKDLVTGLWQCWIVHAASAVTLYFAMYLTSYVKQKCKVLKLLDEDGTVRAVALGPPLAPPLMA